MKSNNMEAGANCILSSIAGIISKYDDSVDDAAMLFAEDGFNVFYSMKGATSINDIKFDSNITRVAKSFLLNRGIKYQIDYAYLHSYLELSETFLQEMLKKSPLLAVVDSSSLDYNLVYSSNARREHVINVFNAIGSSVYFSDCFIPTSPVSTYQGEMQFGLFNMAWSGTKYKYIDIDYDKIKKIQFDITNESLWEHVRGNLTRFIENEDKERDLSGLFSFASDVGSFTSKFSDQDISANIKNLSFGIQFTGIIPILHLLKKVLINLKLNSNLAISEQMIGQIDILLERWRKITLMLVKAGFRTSKQQFESISIYTKETVEIKASLLKHIIERVR